MGRRSLWRGYASALVAPLGHARVVVDRFHAIRPWLAAIWATRGVLHGSEGDHAKAAALFNEAAEQFALSRRPSMRPGAAAAAAAASA